MESYFISECKNGHHFINARKCPICSEAIVKQVPFQEGDCISCGVLCPGYAYGCKDHVALKPEDFE